MHAALQGLTVIVPVGPADRLSPVLQQQLAALPGDAEVYVVCADAEYADELRAQLQAALGPQWHCLLSPPGRALQQNAGAGLSQREWLWFVHADSVLGDDALGAVADCLARNERAVGYLDLHFLADGPLLTRINAFGARIRSHWLGLPFGDQALLLPRHAFEQLGGFDPALLHGEDHDLIWRARRAGLPPRALGARIYTSARKYAERGWWRTTAWHLRETWRQARRFSRGRVPL